MSEEPAAKLGYVGEWPEARRIEDLRCLWAGTGLVAIECASDITDLTLDEDGNVIVVTKTGMTRLSAQDLR